MTHLKFRDGSCFIMGCYIHLKALLVQLKVGMDRRLVQTFLGLVVKELRAEKRTYPSKEFYPRLRVGC
jgi:hypothetical protein